MRALTGAATDVGVIGSANNVRNVNLSNIEIQLGTKAITNAGVFGQIKGTAEKITLNNIIVEVASEATATSNYIGGLAGRTYSTVKEITADEIVVKATRTRSATSAR